MKFSHIHIALCLVMLVVMLGGEVQVSTAVTCTITELSSCLPAITGPSPPSATCCAKLKEQQPCLCGYSKDPTYGHYFTSPRAQTVAKICGVPIPKC
ncbi:hypothetical protein ACH5RR_011672 [Cinchona calisaya]|uniref:Bifunctional inhibitor/plant lipid transfer protein/seed storage helical domain-containing protein n=1 Tax=Cinchona calisaya TaxID=153742 RepID=A0ABD3A5K7_9GENT